MLLYFKTVNTTQVPHYVSNEIFLSDAVAESVDKIKSVLTCLCITKMYEMFCEKVLENVEQWVIDGDKGCNAH